MVKKMRVIVKKMGIFEIIVYIIALVFIGISISYEYNIYQEIRHNLKHNYEIKYSLNTGCSGSQLALLESQLKEAIEDRKPFFLAESNILIIPRADGSAILKIRGFSADEK